MLRKFKGKIISVHLNDASLNGICFSLGFLYKIKGKIKRPRLGSSLYSPDSKSNGHWASVITAIRKSNATEVYFRSSIRNSAKEYKGSFIYLHQKPYSYWRHTDKWFICTRAQGRNRNVFAISEKNCALVRCCCFVFVLLFCFVFGFVLFCFVFFNFTLFLWNDVGSASDLTSLQQMSVLKVIRI